MVEERVTALVSRDRRLDEGAPEGEDRRVAGLVVRFDGREHEEGVEEIRDTGRLGSGGLDAGSGEDADVPPRRNGIAGAPYEPAVELPPENEPTGRYFREGRLGATRGVEAPRLVRHGTPFPE
jgi:hypothetical protein